MQIWAIASASGGYDAPIAVNLISLSNRPGVAASELARASNIQIGGPIDEDSAFASPGCSGRRPAAQR
jgi:hypothetical protein